MRCRCMKNSSHVLNTEASPFSLPFPPPTTNMGAAVMYARPQQITTNTLSAFCGTLSAHGTLVSSFHLIFSVISLYNCLTVVYEVRPIHLPLHCEPFSTTEPHNWGRIHSFSGANGSHVHATQGHIARRLGGCQGPYCHNRSTASLPLWRVHPPV